MPVILVTQEAEIRRIAVWSQPGQIVHKTLSQKNISQKKAGGVAQGIGPEFKSQYCKKKKKISQTFLVRSIKCSKRNHFVLLKPFLLWYCFTWVIMRSRDFQIIQICGMYVWKHKWLVLIIVKLKCRNWEHRVGGWWYTLKLAWREIRHANEY
jgi:hypothetical protein